MNTTSNEYSVFASYNSRDRAAVRKIVRRLRRRGVPVWMDILRLLPGVLWQSTLEKEIARSRVALIFFGVHGIGPWQKVEIDAILEQQVNGHCTVIPVLLRGGEVPLLFRRFTWVDVMLRDPDPIRQLVSGVQECDVPLSVEQTRGSMPAIEWALIAGITLAVTGVAHWSPAQFADEAPAQATKLDAVDSVESIPNQELEIRLSDDIGRDASSAVVHKNLDGSQSPPRLLPESPKWSGLAAVTHTAPDAAALIEQALGVVESIPMTPKPQFVLVDLVW